MRWTWKNKNKSCMKPFTAIMYKSWISFDGLVYVLVMALNIYGKLLR